MREPSCACGDSGWIQVPGKRSQVAACLCDSGRAKARGPLRAVGIETIVGEIELHAIYGGTLPVAAVDRVPNALIAAGVPRDWTGRTLHTFAEKFSDTKRMATYGAEWARQPKAKRSDVVLTGPNGTGKTGLAVSMLRACAEQHDTVSFVSVPRLMIDWRALFVADAAETEADVLRRLLAPDVLLLDELTGVKSSEFIEQTMTVVVDERQKLARPTILTMNLPADVSEKQETAFIAALCGPTLYDRLRERAQFWPLRGKSKRSTWKPPEA